MTDTQTTETRDELRSRVLRLLGESSMRRNQIAQADSYLAGIERERARLVRDNQALTEELRTLNGRPRNRKIQELIDRNRNREKVTGMEMDRLGREEVKTRKDRAANVIRAEECERERAELEGKHAAENR